MCTRPRFDSEAQVNSKMVTVWQLLVYKCTCPLSTNAPELATSCTVLSWSVFIRLFLSVLVNDFYSMLFYFRRWVDPFYDGPLSAFVSLLCISMFAVLWYMSVPNTSRTILCSKTVPSLAPLSHLRTTPPHPQGAPGGHD